MLHSVHILVAAYVAWYLASQAMLTKFLWSRYPKKVDAFMTCAACSGAWWVLLMARLANYAKGWLFLGLDEKSAGWLHWPTAHQIGVAALILAYGCFLIPLLAAVHLGALRMTHVEPPADPPVPEA